MPIFQQFGALLLFVILCAALAFTSSSRNSDRSLPVAQLATSSGWTDEQLCSECHFEESELFWETGHAHTLQRANHADSIGLLRKFSEVATSKDPTLSVMLDEREIKITDETGSAERELNLAWCFGSGEHARTWVGTLPDGWGERNLVEFRWTWFRRLQDFDITPGQSEESGAGYYAALGTLFDNPKARLCFSCHATVLPQQSGHTDFEAVHPGVTCQRCHGPRRSHVESEGEIQEGFWRTASQLESVHRCGECHRIAEDQAPEKIDPDNTEIVRFQPVGLVQSPCFRGSKEMTCLTCHDPHRPLNKQDSTGIWQCVQCHDGTAKKHSVCSAGHLDDCLSCHMPKVRTFDVIDFTDHWIRIRETPDPLSP